MTKRQWFFFPCCNQHGFSFHTLLFNTLPIAQKHVFPTTVQRFLSNLITLSHSLLHGNSENSVWIQTVFNFPKLRSICSQAVFEQLAAFTASLCFEHVALFGWQEVRRRWHHSDMCPLRRGAGWPLTPCFHAWWGVLLYIQVYISCVVGKKNYFKNS